MSTMATIPDTRPKSAARGGKFLTFALGGEEYGLEILKVREIVGPLDVTAVPLMPAYMKGVINLRGQVIPVIDLRAKFAMPAQARTQQSCIIVVEFRRAGRKLNFGLAADRVSEVVEIPADQVEDAPACAGAVESDVILGFGKVNQSIKILLDVDRLLNVAEVINLPRLALGQAATGDN